MLKVKVFRMGLGLSQWEIARAVEMSQGRYSMVERGLIECTDEERTRIATVLGANPATLFRPALRPRPPAESSPPVVTSEAIA